MIINIEPHEAYYVANCILYAQEYARWAAENSPLGDGVMDQLGNIVRDNL